MMKFARNIIFVITFPFHFFQWKEKYEKQG